MGCVASRIDKEEKVQICRERKRLMKQLVVFRGDFANALLAYLIALKNTGVTLRQFTDYESLELENVPFTSELPPSPPRLFPLPPSPPPPPHFIPNLDKFGSNLNRGFAQEELTEVDGESSSTPPLPSIKNTWDNWDPFDCSSQDDEHHGLAEQVEEEDWAETRSQFEDDDGKEENFADQAPDIIPMKLQNIDDNSFVTSHQTKDTADATLMLWRSQKTLPGIIKELDDYFLEASAGGKEIAVLIDRERMINQHHNFKDNKRKGNNSAKVFSSLSWAWPSRSLQLNRDAAENGIPDEPCRPGAHCITLEKLYAEEQRLNKAVREEVTAKLEHERKLLLLKKQEEENADENKIEKTRLAIENLQSDMVRLQQLIISSRSSILALIDEQLHPQLVALFSGLLHMWRTMSECHQVQNRISQQVSHIANHRFSDPTTEYHREATLQLENEVKFLHNSFCGLTKAQQEYVSTLSRWAQLTAYLEADEQPTHYSSAVRSACEKWQLALDRLPAKVASEAIKSLLSVVHAIIIQQEEELSLKRKYEKLEKRLCKEVNSLIELEKKLEVSTSFADVESILTPKHPLTVKRAKADALKKRCENEKGKYLSSVQISRAMTLSNLKTSLPNIFQALMGYTGACAQAFETILNFAQPVSHVLRRNE